MQNHNQNNFITAFKPLRNLFQHLTRKRQVQLFAVVLVMLTSAVAELLSLGAILPFLTFLADPEAAHRVPVLDYIMSMIGVRTTSSMLIISTVVFAVAAVLSGFTRIFLNWASFKFIFGIGTDLSVKLYSSALLRPYSFHLSNNTSKILSGIGKVHSVIYLVIMPVMQSLAALILSFSIIGALFYVNPFSASVSVIGFGSIYLLINILTRKQISRNGAIIASNESKRIKILQEGLGGIRDVLLNGAQKYYIDKFRALSGSLAKANVYNNFIGTAPRALLESIMLVLIALLAFFMSVREGGLNHAVPYLGILALGGQKIMPQLQQIYMGWNSLLGHKAAMIHILELLDQDEKLALSTNDSTQVLPFKQSLCIENISFKYTGVDEPVLHNVNLTIKRGERIGFIGKTGSGKSTLIDIIMGLLEPTSGQLNVDSTTITPDNMRLWQNLIAQVPQSLFLSDTTIAENIAFGQEMNQIDMDGVIRAAQGAQLYDFIESLPESFQTVVGERGVRLSGGQRQRIGLARALYKKSQILILDEATSALDDSTEESVMQSLNSIDKNITILMIAHRLSTLKNCDRIVEIDNGRISQILSYEDVFKRSLV